MVNDQEQTPIIFHFAQMAPGGGTSYTVQGSLESRSAAGTLSIPFEFLDASGAVVGTETLTMAAPAQGQVENFRLQVDLGTPLAGFRYRSDGS